MDILNNFVVQRKTFIMLYTQSQSNNTNQNENVGFVSYMSLTVIIKCGCVTIFSEVNTFNVRWQQKKMFSLHLQYNLVKICHGVKNAIFMKSSIKKLIRREINNTCECNWIYFVLNMLPVNTIKNWGLFHENYKKQKTLL